MRKATLREKIQYRFEGTLSAGTIAIIGWLGLLSAVIVVIAGTVIAIMGMSVAGDDKPTNFAEAVYQSLLRTFDPGTFSGDSGWDLRVVTLIVTLAGIFIVSTLIGALSTGLQGTIDEMRKGRTRVLEDGHTLILGWSSKVIPIISELLVSNENQRHGRVVILASRDKVEMEDELRDKLPRRGKTKIICRSGDPLDLVDLEIGNPNGSKSIIVVSSEHDHADISTVKTVLALTNNPRRRKEKYHIVAEIQDEGNIEAANLAGGDEVTLVHSSDLIARLTAQTCRQSGLSVVYTELLDFDGDEMYIKQEKALEEKTFKDAVFAYETSSVMGLVRRDGKVMINPPMNTTIVPGDKLITITEDDDTAVLSGKTSFNIDEQAIVTGVREHTKPERFLVLGWNDRAPVILRELDAYVVKGSEALILAEIDSISDEIDAIAGSLSKLSVRFRIGDTTDRATLHDIDVLSFDTVILLGYGDRDVQIADADTLISLLHLRSISEKANIDIKIVSEMYDVRNRELAEVTKADDFIVSDKIISLMLSQLSENGRLKAVFDDLFSPEGSEIYLKPAGDYVKPGSTVDFYTVLDSASRRHEVAIGYRVMKHEHNPNEQYGIVVNPVKSDKVTFCAEDKIIVLAES